MSTEEAGLYWDSRHRQESDLRSGGDVSFDERTNEMFYALRLGILLDIIGHHADPVAPLFLLDAGCGKGWFSRHLASFGHSVDGIDASASAVAHCREQGGGPQYFQSSLAGWRSPWLYDAVVSVDVVFHILDHQEWERSMRNLASLVRMRGRLIVSDRSELGEQSYGTHQVVRGRDRYLPLMKECGLAFDSWRPYHFRGSALGFYVFIRTG